MRRFDIPVQASVIIPMYNAEDTVVETLEALRGQTCQDIEVTVVDDGSTDKSQELVRQFAAHCDFSVRLLRQKNSGPATARNLGVDAAKAEKILFLDSDCCPAENWVEQMTRSLGNPAAGYYCPNRVKNRESLVARYVDHEMSRPHKSRSHDECALSETDDR